MISFKQFLERLENAETVAVLPGGFKPPTNGHFQALENILQNADKGVVFIGKSPRDGIDQEMAYRIWNIYAPYLSKPVKIIKSLVTPVQSTYDLAVEHNNVNLIVGAGAKDGDITRYNSFIKNPEKPSSAIKPDDKFFVIGLSTCQDKSIEFCLIEPLIKSTDSPKPKLCADIDLS